MWGCVHREHFFVYQKVWFEYSKREAREKAAKNVGPWNRITYIPHRALFGAWMQVAPCATAIAQEVPMDEERQQRLQYQCRGKDLPQG